MRSAAKKISGVDMTEAERLAEFAVRASFDALSETAREQVKIRVLDGLGCAIGAVLGGPVRAIREQIEDFNGSGHCTLIGGGRSAPDRAALYNSALVRYLDFNDSYLAKGETCHPSDNLGSGPFRRRICGADGPGLHGRAGPGLPGAMPAERRGPGAEQGFRSYDPGRLCRRRRGLEGAGP